MNGASLLHFMVVNMRNETSLRFDLFEDFYNEVKENVSVPAILKNVNTLKFDFVTYLQ